MTDSKPEACGRCSMTSVVGMNESDGSDGEDEDRNPFAGDRIEVDKGALRALSQPQILLGRLKTRLDEVATRLTYGR